MTTILIKKRGTTEAPSAANLTNQAGGAEYVWDEAMQTWIKVKTEAV